MRYLIFLLTLFSFSVSAIPVQPSDLLDDDQGDIDVFDLCLLAGQNCQTDVPMMAFMTTDGSVVNQADVNAADKILLFDPFNGLPGDQINTMRLLGETVFGSDSSGVSVLTPDTFVELLVWNTAAGEWNISVDSEPVGPDSVIQTFPDGQQALLVDVVQPDIMETPLPAAAWLFGAGLLGLVGVARR